MISYTTEKGYLAAAGTTSETKNEEITATIEHFGRQLDIFRGEILALLNLLGEKQIVNLFEWKKKYDELRNKQKEVGVVEVKPSARDEQLAASKHRLTLPVTICKKLGQSVDLQYSDKDGSLTIKKSDSGKFKLRQIGKIRSTRSINCRALIEAKKIKKGRYPIRWEEKAQMLVAKVA